ncbi:MAG: 5-methylcytosine-specific restriction endonuclease system specificity protein McrC [Flavobacteriales bacterium]|nr:5-methylcytosine-specific restriction endonuclease system specificity protein McrC [Flavobacteriales bacterium]
MNIPIKNIYYLLSYAWDKLEEAEKLNVSLSDYKDALNLLTRVTVSAGNRLLKKGLDRFYIERSKEYTGVKGKIDFKESLRKNSFRHGKAICTYDEFSTNVLHNQIIKSVLRILTRTQGVETRLKKEVWDCFYRFHGVDEIDIKRRHFSQVKVHRNNFEYDFLLKLSYLIVESCVLSEENGTYQFKDFSRNEKAMASLFEKFVFNFYRKEQSIFKVRREDIRWNATPIADSNPNLLPKMQTDISLEASHRKIVIDTKYYKNTLSAYFEVEKFHSTNLYQIHAYLSNLEKSTSHAMNKNCEGILLYPTVQKEIDEAYQMEKHKVRICTVNLMQEWRGIENRLKQLIC